MTLTLTVQSGDGNGHDASRTIEIGESATIGRAPECTVVLDDAQRGISRIQARIERRDDAYVLVDAGSNPTLLNDEALDGSREATLSNEDRIGIGAYALVVSIEAEAAEAAIDHTLMTRPAPSAPTPVADLPETPEFEAPPPAPLIPDDWNAPHARSMHRAQPVPHDEDVAFTPDPLAATPLLREPGRFGGEADQALMDALSAIDPLREAGAGGVRTAAAPAPALSRSLEHSSPERVMAAMPQAVAPEQPRRDASGAASADKRSAPRRDAHEHEPTPSPTSTPSPNADNTLDALLQGLGIARADVAHIPAPDLARLTGSMLREAVQGTMSVLRSRAMTKRESRMAMTMIEERDNNPLKFFPDADRALTQMLGARSRGYLAPEEALRAAFRDIQAHELALIAGMRAAFDDAMSRFDPAVIERSLDAPGRLDALIGNRRARLWQRFVKTWDTLSHDAGDDFQQRFGEPFGRAYQAQLDALQSAKD
ncbi:FHA domain-containing protein [Caballeronia novacaledonica]|uniref:FHA domain-containing protein n=1 Tax=Caballeronia novacaledonica TaxID=1544861 RepID=A0A2U3I135_9BURK|nr:type VI secretion system-associated FHA domain protein TagH [Caballeronia novacaledonica]SPB13808.1 FHA domain-containing protein [Caballeronia novacaledonica]